MSIPDVAIRPENPKKMSFMPRDGQILQAIHHYDGVLADYQVQRLFFSPAGRKQTRTRLSLLWQNGYLNKPSRNQRARYQYTVFWLDKKGATYIAGQDGEELTNFDYRKKPRWNQVEHDIEVVDFHLDVEEACYRNSRFDLVDWVSEGVFHADPDRVAYTARNGKQVKRNLIPDGFFVIGDTKHKLSARFLLEYDRANKDVGKFINEKVLPGIEYIRTEEYMKRFGANRGWWLVVTTGEKSRRMKSLKEAAERYAGSQARLFFFATIDQVNPGTILTEPIWWRGTEQKPVSLSSLFST